MAKFPPLTFGLVAIAALVFIYFHAPTDFGHYPVCVSKFIFEYDCPGCGFIRGTYALLHLQICEAWQYNPLIFLFYTYFTLLGISQLAGNSQRDYAKKLGEILTSRYTVIAIATAVVLHTISVYA